MVNDPILSHRKDVAERLNILTSTGGWEGAHIDFKKTLEPNRKELGRLIKHVLAFANTPRRGDAYIVFGVEENSIDGRFEHIGVRPGGFVHANQIEELVREHTTLRDVVVDSGFEINGRSTPYVVIPIQYNGPYRLISPISGSGGVVRAEPIYVRYGRSSTPAQERDRRRMEDWQSWFLDCRYEPSTAALTQLLQSRFRDVRSLTDEGTYVRLVHDMSQSDAFGTVKKTVLVHAYAGFTSPTSESVDLIVGDTADSAGERVLLAARLDVSVAAYAKARQIRFENLDKLYFVEDCYARLCREYVESWEQELENRRVPQVIDLDYVDDAGVDSRSILSGLEDALSRPGRWAIVVHGAFGAGKTITAKQFVANLGREYLKRGRQTIKVMYVDVNSIDIRASREECLRVHLLASTKLAREEIERIVAMVNSGEIHLMFDGVDEMARPYSKQGRTEAIEYLRQAGNARSAVFFVRTSFFGNPQDLREAFNQVADFDFDRDQRQVMLFELKQLSQDQAREFLTERLGPEGTSEALRRLQKHRLAQFLSDPLLLSLLLETAEQGEWQALEALADKEAVRVKARLLARLVRHLLNREQRKRWRHDGLARDFGRFFSILCNVAFQMVSVGTNYVPKRTLEAFVQRSLDQRDNVAEAVEAFRTMSWIHRGSGGDLGFRHEALTCICAAEHVVAATLTQNTEALSTWTATAPLAEIVAGYAAELATTAGVVGATGMLGSGAPLHVAELLRSMLQRVDPSNLKDAVTLSGDPRLAAAVLKGIASDAAVSLAGIHVIMGGTSGSTDIRLSLPLLFLLGRANSGAATTAAMVVAERLRVSTRDRDFEDTLRDVRDERDRLVDRLLIKLLDIGVEELLSSDSYHRLFADLAARRSSPLTALDRYVHFTLEAFELRRRERERRLSGERGKGRRDKP